jgi:hypothetical protein
MAIHVYSCPNGHEFERFENINDIFPKKCPRCGKKAQATAGVTATPILKEGVGGFYKPSSSGAVPTPSTVPSSSAGAKSAGWSPTK